MISSRHKLNVHLLEFHELPFSHVEIILETKPENAESQYYFINVISKPRRSATTHASFFIKRIKNAARRLEFELDDDLEQIIEDWQDRYVAMHNMSIPQDSCADVANWFLETYLDIQNPGPCGPPITCNYVCCGLFLPSFLQPITLPGRVMDIAEQKKHKYQHNHATLKMTD